jgi:Plasmodium falciparum domain of unknown function (CPW_WPC)
MALSEIVTTVLIAVIVTLVLLAVYKYVINPQMVIPAGKGSPCPDQWLFNVGSGMCEPQYTTTCGPFDPKTPTLQTPEAKCNLAHTCGTDWPANCP